MVAARVAHPEAVRITKTGHVACISTWCADSWYDVSALLLLQHAVRPLRVLPDMWCSFGHPCVIAQLMGMDGRLDVAYIYSLHVNV
jgi:hypothetical protein